MGNISLSSSDFSNSRVGARFIEQTPFDFDGTLKTINVNFSKGIVSKELYHDALRQFELLVKSNLSPGDYFELVGEDGEKSPLLIKGDSSLPLGHSVKHPYGVFVKSKNGWEKLVPEFSEDLIHKSDIYYSLTQSSSGGITLKKKGSQLKTLALEKKGQYEEKKTNLLKFISDCKVILEKEGCFTFTPSEYAGCERCECTNWEGLTEETRKCYYSYNEACYQCTNIERDLKILRTLIEGVEDSKDYTLSLGQLSTLQKSDAPQEVKARELFRALGFLENDDLLEKAMMDMSKLVKKVVQVRTKSGKVVQSTRWVNPDTGQAANVPVKASEEGQQQQGKKEGEVDFESIVNSDTLSKTQKVRDLVSLGLYNFSELNLLTGCDPYDIKQVLKGAGIDPKSVIAGSINEKLTGEPTPPTGEDGKPLSTEEMRKELGSEKKFRAMLDQMKQERAKKLGITWQDKWDTYDSTLDMLIGDRAIKSLIAYGTGGVGKTFNLMQTMKNNKKVLYEPELDPSPDQYDWVKITGQTNMTDVYRQLYQHNGKIIVFDDCDSMWDNPESANLLKGALDTSDNMVKIGKGPKDPLTGENLPSQFRFKGQIIFISNLKREDIPAPIVDSRAVAIDLTMSMDQTLDKLDDIKDKVGFEDLDGNEMEVSSEVRSEVVKLLRDLKDELRVEQVNGRTFGNLAKVKASLDRRGKKDYESFFKQAVQILDLA